VTEETERYRRLSGKKKSFLIGYYTLWQGSDHLLQIYSRFGVEDYRRFYFSDIQAIVARKTLAGKVQNIALGCFLALFGLWAVSAETAGWSGFHAGVAGLFVVVLMVNWVRGATCETRLVTAVQTEKLHCLHPLKKATKIMDRLQPLIKKAQESLATGNTRPTGVRPPLPRRQGRSVQRPEPSADARGLRKNEAR